MVLRIVTDFVRPSPQLVRDFEKMDTSHLSDAMGKYQTMSSRIKPVGDFGRVCGPAVTVQCKTGDATMIHLAIELARPGDVVVVEGRSEMDFARLGYLVSLRASKKGVRGVVVDGAIRDIHDIRQLGFPVFCCAVTPAGSSTYWPGSINTPINCGGINVSPGDIIVGDQDGVVAVPRDEAEQVLEASKALVRKESEWEEAIKGGASLIKVMKLDEKMRANLATYPKMFSEPIEKWLSEQKKEKEEE